MNERFPHAQITLDDIEASWAGLRPLIVNNGGSDYNGGGKGKLSDESFEQIVESVKEYLEDERQRPVVEKAVNKHKNE